MMENQPPTQPPSDAGSNSMPAAAPTTTTTAASAVSNAMNDGAISSSSIHSTSTRSRTHSADDGLPQPSLEQRFSQGVGDLLLAIEELNQDVVSVKQKKKISEHEVMDWQVSAERVVCILETLYRWALDDIGNTTSPSTVTELFQHCLLKTIQLLQQQVLQVCLDKYTEPQISENDATVDPIDLQNRRKGAQASMARLTELNLIVLCIQQEYFKQQQTQSQQSLQFKTMEEIIELYVQYQLSVLKKRVKPVVAKLVNQRRQGLIAQGQQQSKSSSLLSNLIPKAKVLRVNDDDDEDETNNDDDDDSSEEEEGSPSQQPYVHYHGPVLTVILGEAASLIHPLHAWNAQLVCNNNNLLPRLISTMCQKAMTVLQEQTITLTQTVTDWFWEDQPVDAWMERSNSDTHEKLKRTELANLDGLLEEMAFSCQVMTRYTTFIASVFPVVVEDKDNNVNNNNKSAHNNHNSILHDTIVPVWTWKYASLERYLALQQWQRAASYQAASPVYTVLGRLIQVPSTVEDAHFVSQRSLERAASTHSQQAIGTVAHMICHDIWSNDNESSTTNNEKQQQKQENTTTSPIPTVYQALIEERGCWKYIPTAEEQAAADERKKREKMKELGQGGSQQKAPSSGDFASALLDALDEDLQQEPGGSTTTTSSSGGKHKHKHKSSSSTATERRRDGRGAGGGAADNILTLLSKTEREKQLQKRLDTQFCVMNGIHAAHGACQALVTLLESLLLEAEQEEQQQQQNSATTNDDDKNNNKQKETQKALAMIQLAREDLLGYGQSYRKFLNERFLENLYLWCGAVPNNNDNKTVFLSNQYPKPHQVPFQELQSFLERENYELDGTAIAAAENEDRLERELLGPLKNSKFLQQLSAKCEKDVLEMASEIISQTVVDVILNVLLASQNNGNDTTATDNNNSDSVQQQTPKKKFTDWGALLLSTQVRVLQTYVSSTLFVPPPQADAVVSVVAAAAAAAPMTASPKLLQIWERLLQAVTVLQLERPADWLAYYQSTSLLSATELETILSLRVEFSQDAVHSVVSTVRSNHERNAPTG